MIASGQSSLLIRFARCRCLAFVLFQRLSPIFATDRRRKVRERLGVVDATVELWLRRSATMLSRGGSETDTEVLQVLILNPRGASCLQGVCARRVPFTVLIKVTGRDARTIEHSQASCFYVGACQLRESGDSRGNLAASRCGSEQPRAGGYVRVSYYTYILHVFRSAPVFLSGLVCTKPLFVGRVLSRQARVSGAR